MTSPPKLRRRAPYHHGNLPEALVAAARAMIEREGCEALTLRGVAQRVGVTHAAPYRHFKDKRALLSAVADSARGELCRALQRAVSDMNDFPPCGARGAQSPAVVCGEAYFRYAREHTALFQLMFGPRDGFRAYASASPRPGPEGSASKDNGAHLAAAGSFPPVAPGVTDASHDEDGDLRALFADAAGSAAHGDALWSLWHGLAMLAVDGRLAPDRAILDAASDTAVRLCGRADFFPPVGPEPPHSARQPTQHSDPLSGATQSDAADPG